MFGFFRKKAQEDDFEQLKKGVQTGFNNVKQDVSSLSTWIKHLNSKDEQFKQQFSQIKDEVLELREEIENLKNMLAIVSDGPLFKQKQTVFNKQTAFKPVLNTVQTAVQTVFLENLSATERAIVFVLLNSDMKLSYEDLAAMLGKNKATIRGQINTIKQKSEGLVEEQISEGNKKRVYIPEKIKEVLLKKMKNQENTKKTNKNEKSEE
ncbi:MAG: hypothetical protein ACP5OG_01980 [Candidatus Nanoarchaeia archaeon]